MRDTFTIMGLRRKRAHMAGEIEAAQSALNKRRRELATLDAVLNMFAPDTDPELIPSIRPVKKGLFFRHGEVTRLCIAALRAAEKPVMTSHVTDYAMETKGIPTEPLVREQIGATVRQTLHRLAERGIVRKIVDWPDMWWELGR
jgi:hypothetical protein